MRAAILGAVGTPYHDQLFLFDIQLAADHPHRPPKVHYHAFGFRVNPNLYADGNVSPENALFYPELSLGLINVACTHVQTNSKAWR